MECVSPCHPQVQQQIGHNLHLAQGRKGSQWVHRALEEIAVCHTSDWCQMCWGEGKFAEVE